MPTQNIEQSTLGLAALLLSLSREQLGSTEGRQRLAGALRTTLDAVELLDGAGARPMCGSCLLSRPGVGRAVRNLAHLLNDAQEHVELLVEVTQPPVTTRSPVAA